MRKLLFIALIAGSSMAFADINHAQLVNKPAGGTGALAGADISQLETGEGTFGYGVQAASNNIMADDFTVGAGGFNVTGISVFAYVTGATAPTLSQVNWALGAAPTTTLTSSAVTTQWYNDTNPLGVWRTTFNDTSTANRRLMLGRVTGLNLNLAAGTHFLSFNVVGANFSPPLPNSLAVHGKNAQQSVAAGPFAPVVNGTVGGADMSFIIHGTAVPEPATMAALGLGIAAMVRRRRKASK